MDDKDPETPHRIENLGFHFAVGKPHIFRLDRKIGTLEGCWCFGAGNSFIGKVIGEGDGFKNLFFTDAMPFGKSAGKLIIAL